MGLLLSCSHNVERELGPAPGAASFPVEITPSKKLTSIETALQDTQGEPIWVKCASCHENVEIGSIATRTTELKEFHRGLSFSHGTMSCKNCHEPGAPLKLHLATGEVVPLEEAMQLCSQCHGPKRVAYDHGAHGGKTGYWDLSRGAQKKNHCVDCHDPHTPQIARVIPARRPVDRGATPSNQDSKRHQ